MQASFFEGKLTWTIRPDGIIVGATSVEHDCGAIVGRALAALPVTPMRAVGSNFSYAGNVDAVPPGTELAEALRDSSIDGLVHTSISKSLQRDGVTYNVGATRTGGAVHLTVNVHRDVDTGKNGVEPAFAFMKDRESSSALAREIFGIEVVADGD